MPNLKPVGSNQTEIEKTNGVTVLYSYSTPVAVFIPGQGAVCTSTKHSKTTSAHINAAVKRWDCSRRDVPQEVIDQYAGA